MRKIGLVSLYSLLSFVFGQQVGATMQNTSASSHETYLEMDQLKKISLMSVRFTTDVDDSEWDYLPLKLRGLDLSNINSLSEKGMQKIKTMTVESLNISNLNLYDDALQFLPSGLKYLNISGNPMGGFGLQYLPETLEEINLQQTLIPDKAITQYLSDRLNLKIDR
jgi:hypothetical protein